MRIEQQIRAVRPDRSVLLSASAGSGKTRALVHRMIHLLAAGAPPGEIVAATFSEKAAAQMEERLYDELIRASGEGKDVAGLIGLVPEDTPYPIVNDPELILSTLSSQPGALRISTIHALCLWILRRFPLEAGLPPDFTVMDDWKQPLLREQAVDECLDTLANSGGMDDFESLISLGYRYNGVRSLMLDAFEKRPHLMKLALDAGGPEELVGRVMDGLGVEERVSAAQDTLSRRTVQDTAARLSSLLPADTPKLAGYKSALDAMAGVIGPEDFARAFEGLKGWLYNAKGELLKRPPLTNDAAKYAVLSGDPSLKGQSRDAAVSKLKAAHDELYTSMREEATGVAGLLDYATGALGLAALMRLFFRAESMYTSSARSEGLVDYDDLEICTYGLLKRPESAGMLAGLESRATHYLVDEFQDTGELQWGIIERLMTEAFSGQGVEGIKSPTVFAVGDRKQSIYRFRMANPRIMDRLANKMRETMEPEGCDFPSLEHNFRSAPEILRVVDEAFTRFLPAEYENAVAFREDARGSVTMSFHETAEEAGALAASIESALGLPVWDGSGFRPAGYGDMAVLMRSRTRLSAYEDALRTRGIPFKVVGGVGFFRQPEIRAVVGLLNFLDDPAELLSLASALKSPLFGLTDGELEALYAGSDPMDALNAISPEAHGMISGWRGLAGVSTPGRIVGEVIDGSAAAFVFGTNGGPAAILNLEKLANLAREFDRMGGAGLTEFTGWVREYRDTTEMAAADVELPEYSEFVSVMTVHAAKGLEFPVVLIAGADVVPRRYAGRFLAGTVEPGDLAVSTGGLLGNNPIYDRLKGLEKEASIDEAKRLLYVAMTRAMDHLFISSGCKTGSEDGCSPPPDSWAGLLLKAAPPSLLPHEIEQFGPGASFSHPAVACEKAEYPGQAEQYGRTGLAGRRGALAPLPEPPATSFISPSGLVDIHAEESEGESTYSAMLRGSAIHRAIESAGKTGTYDARTACASQHGFGALSRENAAKLVEDVDRTVGAFLAAPAVIELLSSGDDRFFELPLMMQDDGKIAYGSADLVVRAGDSISVYDFKSGLSAMAHYDIKTAYYQQLALYTAAAREAFGVSAARCFIVLVDTAEFIEL